MSQAKVNGIEICYDEFGSPSDRPLLLVMGFTAQMTAWEEGFCNTLADRGFRVIRYDNRDVGLSSKTKGTPPSITGLGPDGVPQLSAAAPYTLTDMAKDGIELLTQLGIDAAHVVGASMGGMIVQHMAIEYPQRVLSMTSIMSTTGDRSVGQPAPESLALLLTPPPAERGAYIDRSAEIGRVIAGPLFDEERARDRAGKSFDRCFHPVGAAFQLAAILSDADRTPALGSVRCPTLVIHGRADSLVNASGGEATAKAIPGAELVLFDEMGHDLPEKLWPDIADAIAKNAARA